MKLLVGAVSVVGVLLAGCGERTTPEAEPEPTPTAPAQAQAQAVQTATPVEPWPHAIPEDFPLLDGYPTNDQAEGDTYGREGPSRELPPIEPTACGDTVRLPDHEDWLRGEWTNVEDLRQRQLVLLPDEPAARTYAERVVDLYRGCPVDQLDEHSRVTTTVEAGTLGDWSAVAVSHDEYDGRPTTGLVTTQVVRVGRAVLIAIEYGEGGAAEDAVANGVQRSTDAVLGVVAAMADLPEEVPAEPAFGPEGFGQVVLALPREQLLALPGVRLDGGNDQCDGFEAPGISGGVQPGLGVAYIGMRADLETPEGVRHGSTYEEVLAVYPDAEGDRDVLTAEPRGYDDRYYRIELLEGRVTGVVLMHWDQSCAS